MSIFLTMGHYRQGNGRILSFNRIQKSQKKLPGFFMCGESIILLSIAPLHFSTALHMEKRLWWGSRDGLNWLCRVRATHAPEKWLHFGEGGGNISLDHQMFRRYIITFCLLSHPGTKIEHMDSHKSSSLYKSTFCFDADYPNARKAWKFLLIKNFKILGEFLTNVN